MNQMRLDNVIGVEVEWYTHELTGIAALKTTKQACQEVQL